MDNATLLPVYSAFGGIILGAVATFAPAYLLERLKKKDEIAAVTGAIATEIKVTLELLAKRRYVETIEKQLADLRSGKSTGATFQVMIPDDYSPIYKSHLDKVGLLPACIRNDVVTFYQLMEAAICDVRPGGLMAANRCGEQEFAELHHIATEAVRVGNEVVRIYNDPARKLA